MQRLRVTLITAAVVTALTTWTLSSLAQQPGPNGGQGRGGRGGFGGPGGFGGFGGPGGFGGFGGFGGPGGSALGLAMNPVIQEELKVKETQKTKLKSLSDTVDAHRRELFSQMNPGQGQGQAQGKGQGGRGRNRNGNNGNGNGNGNGGGGQGGQFGGGFGGGNNANPFAPGGGGFVGGQNPNPGGNGNGGNGNQNRQGRGNFGQDPERMQQFAMMREAMNELNQNAEAALARILDRGQYTRVKQIQLQTEGPAALVRPDMIEKLNMDEAQVAQIEELLGTRRQAQRDNGRARMELMKSAFPNPNPGNNGQNGGNGRNRNPWNDPATREAMQKFMDDPQVKAKMETFRSQDEKLNDQLLAQVNRVLGKRQSAAYKKLLGAPFDMAKLRGGPGGPFGRNGNANRADASKAKASPSPGDAAGAPSASNSPKATAAPAQAPAASSSARPKRKSLRELRGVPDKSE